MASGNESDTLLALFNNCDLLRIQFEALSDPFYKEPEKRTFITVLYSTVAIVGAVGNLMVITAVLRNAQMRTPRNYFIINLALSDLLMCTLTVPFTLYYVLNQFWDLGSTACKIVASAQGVNIFVSTMSITAIGLDRYWVIIFPTKIQQQQLVIAGCFMSIWIFSFSLASPLFYATDATLPIELKDAAEECGIVLFVCSENWDGMIIGKGAYSMSSTVFQYVLPLSMLTFAYTRIIWRLKNRMVHRDRATFSSQYENGTGGNHPMNYNRRVTEQRQRRMNLLLICLVAFFAVCWLPLNVYNSLCSFELDVYNVVVFVTCHAFGMTSACANPILYGVFNENFRAEFIAILTFLRITPVYRYLMGKLAVGRPRNCVNDENSCPTITATTKLADRLSHETLDGTLSEPRKQKQQRKMSAWSSERPRVARFQKFKPAEEPEFIYKVATSIKMSSPSKNGCYSLQTTADTKEEGNKGKGIVNGGMTPSDTSSQDRETVSEEKIPLFPAKSAVSGGNVKSYMRSTQL